MTYSKFLEDDYIVGVGTGAGGTEITETEYNAITAKIGARPAAQSGYRYRLRNSDLEWILCELPPDPEDPEIEDSEALGIITGGAV